MPAQRSHRVSARDASAAPTSAGSPAAGVHSPPRNGPPNVPPPQSLNDAVTQPLRQQHVLSADAPAFAVPPQQQPQQQMEIVPQVSAADVAALQLPQQGIDVLNLMNLMLPLLMKALTPCLETIVNKACGNRPAAPAPAEPTTVGLESEYRKLEKQRQDMQCQIDQMEQASRANNIILKGLGEENEEDITVKVIEKARQINVELTPADIDTCFRLGRDKARGPRSIMLRLKSKHTKIALMKNKKQLSNNVYMEDDLTKFRSSIYYSIRKCEKTFKSWTVDGKIFTTLRDDPNKQKIQINTPNDMEKLGWEKAKIDDLWNQLLQK